MRKDKGLNGDVDRIPMITWILFLKFLDDHELIRETEAKLSNTEFRSIIASPYRWRDWAAKEDGITGSELLAFINQDEATRPDGTRGLGLFAYLRSLSGSEGKDRRDVVATVFKGVTNRMINGYLLREVINKINGIHFSSTEEIHTLAFLYESLLKEMRDSAGDAGEFYTPRPVIKFMVKLANPQLGETVLDPAAGTGGFLVEAFEHLKAQCKKSEDFDVLQKRTLFGFEAKPMPFLLCQMNMLLHGIENPEIDSGNALRFPLREIGDKDRIDIVLTNPPFGGEEERGILGNFPEDKQTSETTLLFLQLIMRKLRRQPKGGRCAVVVSDGFLSTKGVAARVKEELLSEFNLHTIVRLPKGVFVPYTPIATNILFFDRSGSTEKIWYYEVPGPKDRQTYSKTKPFKYDEMSDCLSWWDSRVKTSQAWQIRKDEIVARGYDLDIQNPSSANANEAHYPRKLVAAITEHTQKAATIAAGIERLFSPDSLSSIGSASYRKVGDFLRLRKEVTIIDDAEKYRLLTVQLHARGIRFREEKLGSAIKTKKQQIVNEGEFVVAEIDAKVGGFGIVPPECSGAIVSSHYFVYEVNKKIIDPRFFEWWIRSGIPEQLIQPFVKGSTNYAAIRQHHFPLLEMRVPTSLDEQRRIVSELNALQIEVEALKHLEAKTVVALDAVLPAILERSFKGEL